MPSIKSLGARISLAIVLSLALSSILACSRDDKPILLRGTIVAADGVIDDGWVLVQGGRIRVASISRPNVPNALEVDTGGIIFPGLVDLHNHISYNVLPRWNPGRLYLDRYEWRTDPGYVRFVEKPYKQLVDDDGLFCDMNTYGELRALAGGTTSILATAPASCIQGLVRNLDHESGFYGVLERDATHVRHEIEMRSTTRTPVVTSAKTFVARKGSEAFLVHLAEGINASSREEFEFLRAQGLLTAKTAIIHGIALGPPEFQAMRQSGTSLVWSPRSNVALYGRTASVAEVLDAGVRVALAPDWAITGCSNLLDELRFAAQWNVDHLSSRLSDRQLVAMVTSTPAQIAGVADEVGSIREGLRADLLVLSGDRRKPYRALIEARAKDVQLVLVGGQPLYGARGWMEAFWKRSELDEVNLGGAMKVVKLPKAAGRIPELQAKLQAALAAQGTQLAPMQ